MSLPAFVIVYMFAFVRVCSCVHACLRGCFFFLFVSVSTCVCMRAFVCVSLAGYVIVYVFVFVRVCSACVCVHSCL